MTKTSDQQRANVAAFHALPEAVPARSLESWRALVKGWKARMCVSVVVGELRALLDEVEQLQAEARHEQAMMGEDKP